MPLDERFRVKADEFMNENAAASHRSAALRAERKCGELLQDMAERGERDKGKGNRNPALKSQRATPNLDSLGLDKHEASRFQQIAAVPEPEFEGYIRETVVHDRTNENGARRRRSRASQTALRA